MASTGELKKRRTALRDREAKVDKLVRDEKADERHLEKELDEERKERDELEKRRKQLREEIEDEIKRDKEGKGRHPDHWEEWAEERRDELADLIDASEGRINRLVERAIKSKHDLKKLEKRDKTLEQRIKAVNKRIARKKDPKNNLTKDFSTAEFDCNNGTPVPDGIVPHLKKLCEDHLQPLRDSGGSVNINSGYRTASYNAAIGGVSNSYHVYTVRMRAPAADHVQAGRSASSVQKWHDSHGNPDGMGYYGGFTHIDERGYRSRWYGGA
jgi:hypothetical protein